MQANTSCFMCIPPYLYVDIEDVCLYPRFYSCSLAKHYTLETCWVLGLPYMKSIPIHSFIAIYKGLGYCLSSRFDSNNDIQRINRFLELFSVMDEYSYSLFKQYLNCYQLLRQLCIL
jgi:hypothetical protein